jgi:hypothetical protein
MEMPRSDERQLFQNVLEIVNRYDFCALEPGAPDGAPMDEYTMEARPMESILVNEGHIEVADIRAIWLRFFSDDLSGAGDAVAHMASELNALVRAPAEGP